MVQDERVTRQLNRLGGIYRDPGRVNRDASTLLKSSVGQHLTPIAAIHVDDVGTKHTVLVLQGTIAIHFRGATYQILMDIYLIPGYPAKPPLCYVRLVPNMYIKDNHKHVGKDGKVYLPYLSEWNPHTHNLVELTVAMSSVFSADPPVFSRAGAATTTSHPPATTTAQPSYASGNNGSNNNHIDYSMPFSQALRPPALSPPPPPVTASSFFGGWGTSSTATPQPTPPPAVTTTALLYNNVASSSTSTTPNSWRDQQMQLEAMMAQEAAEANAAAEAARLADQREREQLAQRTRDLDRLKVECTNKIRHHLQQQGELTQKLVYDDALDKRRLAEYPLSRLQQDIRRLEDKKVALEKGIALVDEKTVAIKEWLDQAKKATARKANNNNSQKPPELSVDELVVPVGPLHAQMLDLAAENAALGDALYFADRALQQHDIDATDHLKLVRQIAKRQFFCRALSLKIETVLHRRTPL
jgi:ESCRT-I complex subunit TSG101